VISRRIFPKSAASVSAARRFVAATLDNVPSEVVDSVALMVSELATNAVEHAASEFELVVEHDTDRVLVTVSDRGGGRPRARHPQASDPSGRGLQIVGALADEWGECAPTGAWQKSVWFSVVLRQSSSTRRARR
jgi:anti-sigma regulatory factor (Ser/Thr protein kinase)